MRENTARTSTRWGAKEEKTVPGGATVDVAQFVDMALLAPQELALALYALTDAPIPGITVDWSLQIGCGSVNHTEFISVPASDVLVQIPVLLTRSASRIQASARIRSIAGAPKNVKLVVFIGPTSPTWLTDLSCEEER